MDFIAAVLLLVGLRREWFSEPEETGGFGACMIGFEIV